MIDYGIADRSLEESPYVCGAYFAVAFTKQDAAHLTEIREQCLAQLLGWA